MSFARWFAPRNQRSSNPRTRTRARLRLAFETLEERAVPAAFYGHAGSLVLDSFAGGETVEVAKIAADKVQVALSLPGSVWTPTGDIPAGVSGEGTNALIFDSDEFTGAISLGSAIEGLDFTLRFAGSGGFGPFANQISVSAIGSEVVFDTAPSAFAHRLDITLFDERPIVFDAPVSAAGDGIFVYTEGLVRINSPISTPAALGRSGVIFIQGGRVEINANLTTGTATGGVDEFDLSTYGGDIHILSQSDIVGSAAAHLTGGNAIRMVPGNEAFGGSILLDAVGEIRMAAPDNALRGGNTIVNPTVVFRDSGGSIQIGNLGAPTRISSDGGTGKISLRTGAGSGRAGLLYPNANHGLLQVSTSHVAGTDGSIFITSNSHLTVGDVNSTGAPGSQIVIETTGGGNLYFIAQNNAEDLYGDDVILSATTGKLVIHELSADNPIDLGSGNLTLIGDEIDIELGLIDHTINPAPNSIVSSGTLTIRPGSPGRTIRLAGAKDSDAAGRLDLTKADLDAFKDGFSQIIIGRAEDATGTVYLADDYTFKDATSIHGGSILVDMAFRSTVPTLATTAGNDLSLHARTGAILGHVDGPSGAPFRVNPGGTLYLRGDAPDGNADMFVETAQPFTLSPATLITGAGRDRIILYTTEGNDIALAADLTLNDDLLFEAGRVVTFFPPAPEPVINYSAAFLYGSNDLTTAALEIRAASIASTGDAVFTTTHGEIFLLARAPGSYTGAHPGMVGGVGGGAFAVVAQAPGGDADVTILAGADLVLGTPTLAITTGSGKDRLIVSGTGITVAGDLIYNDSMILQAGFVTIEGGRTVEAAHLHIVGGSITTTGDATLRTTEGAMFLDSSGYVGGQSGGSLHLEALAPGGAAHITVHAGVSLTIGTPALTFLTGSGVDDVSIKTTDGDITVVANYTSNDNLVLDAFGTVAFTGFIPVNPFQAGVGNLTVIAAEIDIDTGGGGFDLVRGTGALTLRPNAPGLPVHLGSTTSATDRLDLTAAELAAFKDGFSSITIGRAEDATGVVTLAGNVTFRDPVAIHGGSIVDGIPFFDEHNPDASYFVLATTAGNALTLHARTGAIGVAPLIDPLVVNPGGPLFLAADAGGGNADVFVEVLGSLTVSANTIGTGAGFDHVNLRTRGALTVAGNVALNDYAVFDVAGTFTLLDSFTLEAGRLDVRADAITTAGTATLKATIGDLSLNAILGTVGSTGGTLHLIATASDGLAGISVGAKTSLAVGPGAPLNVMTGPGFDRVGLGSTTGNLIIESNLTLNDDLLLTAYSGTVAVRNGVTLEAGALTAFADAITAIGTGTLRTTSGAMFISGGSVGGVGGSSLVLNAAAPGGAAVTVTAANGLTVGAGASVDLTTGAGEDTVLLQTSAGDIIVAGNVTLNDNVTLDATLGAGTPTPGAVVVNNGVTFTAKSIAAIAGTGIRTLGTGKFHATGGDVTLRSTGSAIGSEANPVNLQAQGRLNMRTEASGAVNSNVYVASVGTLAVGDVFTGPDSGVVSIAVSSGDVNFLVPIDVNDRVKIAATAGTIGLGFELAANGFELYAGQNLQGGGKIKTHAQAGVLLLEVGGTVGTAELPMVFDIDATGLLRSTSGGDQNLIVPAGTIAVQIDEFDAGGAGLNLHGGEFVATKHTSISSTSALAVGADAIFDTGPFNIVARLLRVLGGKIRSAVGGGFSSLFGSEFFGGVLNGLSGGSVSIFPKGTYTTTPWTLIEGSNTTEVTVTPGSEARNDPVGVGEVAVTVEAGGTLSGGGAAPDASSMGHVIVRDTDPLRPAEPGVVGIGASPAILTMHGLTMGVGAKLVIEIFGTTPGMAANNHDQAFIRGGVTLNDAVLVLDFGGFVPAVGDQFVIIANDGDDAIQGSLFRGLPEGAIAAVVGGRAIRISYVGGDGNDVVLTVLDGHAPEFNTAPSTFVYESDEYSYSIVVTDQDEEDTLIITAPTKPAWLTFTDHGNGTATLVGTPAFADIGSHSVVLDVYDGTSHIRQAFTITVDDRNVAPGFTSTPVTEATEDEVYTYNITAVDANVGDTIRLIANLKPAWLTLTDHGDGTATLTGTPTNADVGSHEVRINAWDANLFTPQVFWILVADNNVGPTFTSTPVTFTFEDDAYEYVITTSDANLGDTLVLDAVTMPAWLALTLDGAGGGTLAGTPTNNHVGDHNVVLRVFDGTIATLQSFTINVNNTNDAPAFTSTPPTSVIEDNVYTYKVTAADVDAGAVLSFSAILPAWLTLTDHGNGTATLAGTPDFPDVGVHDIVLVVSDGGLNVEQLFTVTVIDPNIPPTFASTPLTSAFEDNVYTYEVVAGDQDAGDMLTITALTKPGWLSFHDHGNRTATLTGTPTDGDLGSHAIVLEVFDGRAHVQQSFMINVANTNDAPTGISARVTTFANVAIVFAAESFGFNDLDDTPANALAAVKITTLPGAGSLTNDGNPVAAGQFISAADLAAGKLRFTPAPGAHGNPYASFTFQVQDDGGTAHAGQDLDPNPRTLTIRVLAANEAPTVAAPIADLTVDEDAAPVLGHAVLDAVFADADNLDSELTYSITAVTPSGIVTATIGPDGALDLSFAANASGIVDITVRATDPLGLFVEDTFRVTVNAVNDAPTVFVPITDLTVLQGPAPFLDYADLNTVFADVDHADAELTYTVTGNTGAGIVTATIGADGTLDLSFAAAQNGSADITIRATDPQGGFVETTFRVTVLPRTATTTTIAQATPSPSVFGQAVTFTVTVASNGPGNDLPTGKLTFMDGATVLGVSSELADVGGVATATFTTTQLQPGARTITAHYDGDALYVPSGSADFAHTVNRAATTTTVTLSNPSPSVFGELVTFTITVTPAAGGILPAGTLTLMDGANALGTSTPLVNVGGVATATFATSQLGAGAHTITAHYAGNAFFAAGDSAGFTHTVNPAATTATVTLSSPSPSVVGQTVTFTITVAPGASGILPTGTLTLMDGATVLGVSTPLTDVGGVATATFTTTPGQLPVGARSITAVYAGDANFAAVTSAAFTHTVNPLTGVKDTYNAKKNKKLNVTAAKGVLANDGQTGVQAKLVKKPKKGTLVLKANGSFTYTPAPNTVGVFTFSYRLSNAFGVSAPITVTIRVK
jgi:hypothetical protein